MLFRRRKRKHGKTGEETFKYNKSIRYGLSAIKSIGKPVIDAIVRERNQNGIYRNFRNFVERLSGKELNKRTIENFIKAGALDGLCDNRKQLMMIYVQVVDSVNQEKKNAMAGQMSLFDFVAEEDKKDFEIRMPDVEEYDKEQLLAFEKKCLACISAGILWKNMKRCGRKIFRQLPWILPIRKNCTAPACLMEQRRSSEAWSKALRSSIQKQ